MRKNLKIHYGSKEIYENFKAKITQGDLKKNTKLPSSRSLALEFSISRTTVSLAYEQLSAEGYIEARQGSRPYVIFEASKTNNQHKKIKQTSSNLSKFGKIISSKNFILPANNNPKINFKYGVFDATDFPFSHYKKACLKTLNKARDKITYVDPAGITTLKESIKNYLWRSRNLKCDSEQVIIVNGSQQGLDLCARLFLDTNDTFVIENPCYEIAKSTFIATGATPILSEVDSEGIDVNFTSNQNAKFVYLTPSHQFPLGSILSVSRRMKILNWALKNGSYIIEDDYDSEFRYDIKPAPPLFNLDDNARVIYLGTFSKTLSPALRIGYMIVPHNLIEAFKKAKQITDRHTQVFEQEILVELLENGIYERHIRKLRKKNELRRNKILALLATNFKDSISITGSNAGLHLIATFKNIQCTKEDTIISEAFADGVGIYSVAKLFGKYKSKSKPNRLSLILGYSSLSLGQIEEGMKILSRIIKKYNLQS